MKRIVLMGAIMSACLAGCTTVSMSDTAAPAPFVETAVKAKSAIARSAKSLFYVFSKENWCPEYQAQESQSAMSILLKGMRKTASNTDNTQTYIASVSSVENVRSDIRKAQNHVQTVTLHARNLLDENPDLMSVRSELNALEKALIVSRQAEATFSKAITQTSGAAKADTDSDLATFKLSVDDLRATTDAYGDRMRNDVVLTQAG